MKDAIWEISEPAYEADAANPQLEISPWAGHRDFAYDLVRFLKPALIVELGVHYACSFFAFCQAVKDGGLPTRVVGVDTWKGDPHAGFYGEEIFDLVCKIKAQSFADDRFVPQRATFNEAVGGFADGSVDLLHIDGLHTYDAVQSDYLTWLPKLSPNGLVLLHDVAESSGYESARFWSELKRQHPHFEFPHSWGLGLVFPKGEAWYEACLRQRLPDKMRGYRYRAEFLLCRRRAAMDTHFLKNQMDKNYVRAEQETNRADREADRANRLEQEMKTWPFALGRLVARLKRVPRRPPTDPKP